MYENWDTLLNIALFSYIKISHKLNVKFLGFH